MTSKSRRKKARGVGLPLDHLSAAMQRHVRLLGYTTVDAYFEWCRRHRFAQKPHKTNIERDREFAHAMRARADERARTARKTRNPKAAIRRLLAGDDAANIGGYEPLANELRARRPPGDGRQALLRSLLRRLLAVAPRLLEPDDEGLPVLLHMLEHGRDRVRDPATWRPTSRNRRRMLESLLRHCFVEFEPPATLRDCWFEHDAAAARHRRWFVALARGRNLRSLDLPIEYSRKMAHWFAFAPDDFDPDAALRYGQVRGLGGSDKLARSVCASRLGRTFEHDPFWRTVVAFFARHGFERSYEVQAIVDYLHDQRFVGAAYVDEHGNRRQLPPPQPNLTMAGRDPAALRRQSEQWHSRFGCGANSSECALRWDPSDLAGYREVQGEGAEQRTWIVVELCSGSELRHEGQTMGHCVYTYANACAEGSSRIFSVRLVRGDAVEHVATVEWWRGSFVQVRGPRNAPPSPQAQRVIRNWAEHIDVPVRSYAW